MRRNNARPCRFGFSLVELLVVIVVIAILLALLVPGLMSARTNARDVLCQSRQRQICAAVVQSMQHARDRDMTPGKNTNPGHVGGWTIDLLPYLDPQFSKPKPGIPTGDSPEELYRLPEIFRCPNQQVATDLETRVDFAHFVFVRGAFAEECVVIDAPYGTQVPWVEGPRLRDMFFEPHELVGKGPHNGNYHSTTAASGMMLIETLDDWRK